MLRRLLPNIVWGRCELKRGVGEDAVRGNDVFAKILVLIITPHHNHIRAKRIQRRARLIQPAHQLASMASCRCHALIVAPFFLHRFRPARRFAQFERQRWILQHALENERHAFIRPSQWRIVRNAEREDFGHISSPQAVRTTLAFRTTLAVRTTLASCCASIKEDGVENIGYCEMIPSVYTVCK